MEYFFLAIVSTILLVGVFLTFGFSQKKHLKKNKEDYYQKEIEKISMLPSATERIIRYDMVMHHILKDHGYSGSVGDQLKAKPRIITNLDAIWSLHKLRNKLAHSLESISDGLLEKKADEFKKAVLQLL